MISVIPISDLTFVIPISNRVLSRYPNFSPVIPLSQIPLSGPYYGYYGHYGHYGRYGHSAGSLRTLRDVAGLSYGHYGRCRSYGFMDVTDITHGAGVTDVTDITGGTVRHMA